MKQLINNFLKLFLAHRTPVLTYSRKVTERTAIRKEADLEQPFETARALRHSSKIHNGNINQE